MTPVQRVRIQWLLISKSARYTLCRYENLRVDEEEEEKKAYPGVDGSFHGEGNAAWKRASSLQADTHSVLGADETQARWSLRPKHTRTLIRCGHLPVHHLGQQAEQVVRKFTVGFLHQVCLCDTSFPDGNVFLADVLGPSLQIFWAWEAILTQTAAHSCSQLSHSDFIL